MFRRLTAFPPPALKKWCVYALILLAPGALIVLPLIWLVKLYRAMKDRALRDDLSRSGEVSSGSSRNDMPAPASAGEHAAPAPSPLHQIAA